MIDAGVRDADPLRPRETRRCSTSRRSATATAASRRRVPPTRPRTLVVGSTWAIGDDRNPSTSIDSLSSNSAHGPALDGRRIPHLVAPGCYVDSTKPDLGGGYESRPLCGTSMAAPQVSGSRGAVHPVLPRPSGRHGRSEPGADQGGPAGGRSRPAGNQDADGAALGHRPDNKQGWGRLDLGALVAAAPGSVIYYDQARVFEESGENWLREVTPVDPSEPMRIMLVWTDAPGPGLGGSTPAWNNDLDLVVEAGGSTYLGNVFGSNGWSATGGPRTSRTTRRGSSSGFLRHSSRSACWRSTSTPTACPTTATASIRTSRWSATTASSPPGSIWTPTRSPATSAPPAAAVRDRRRAAQRLHDPSRCRSAACRRERPRASTSIRSRPAADRCCRSTPARWPTAITACS